MTDTSQDKNGTPSAGEIRFQGQPINALPLHERARLGITMTWQEPARFEGLRVIDYLSLRKEIVDYRTRIVEILRGNTPPVR